MTVNELIKKLKLTAEAGYISNPLKKDIEIYVSSDEEWNTLFKDIEVELDEDNNIVIFGLSGSEKEDKYYEYGKTLTDEELKAELRKEELKPTT